MTEGNRCTATYFKPYHLLGSIGPSAAIAEFIDSCLTIYSHSQGPHVIRAAIAHALAISPDQITVIHKENAGCYEHNGADAAMGAALLACHYPGYPIFLQWHRDNEHLWEPFSPATLIELDHASRTVLSTHGMLPSTARLTWADHFPWGEASNLVAAWQKADKVPRAQARSLLAVHGGIHRNADPYYEIPEKRIIKNLIKDKKVRTSSTRSLGAFANVFAIESSMNELALTNGQNAIQFRLDHLKDIRAKEVIKSAAVRLNEYRSIELAGYQYGRSLAFSRYKNSKCYATVGVILGVNQETFEISLQHTVISADAGQIIDADGLTNQLEEEVIQAASWTLKETVQFDEYASVSDNWDSYPILTFPEVPTIETILLNQLGAPSLGAGEATQGPSPAAIGNAVFDATGIRIREIPFLPERMRSLALD